MSLIREPYMVIHQEKKTFKDTYGGVEGIVPVECMRIHNGEAKATQVVVFSHPIGGGSFLPLVNQLAHTGTHVIYVNPRFRGNDTALIMEKCVLDLGAAIKHAKENFGYEKVYLGGWSGGGSLSLFYQDQAENPSITETPAGDPCDVAGAGHIPADGIMLLAAHVSRAATLTEWMDPSILDENDPFNRDRSLNIYSDDCPDKAPYSDEFVKRFRQAQIDRNHRITAWVREELHKIRSSDEPHRERCFCVQGTMADVRWTDPTQDPSDRRPYECYLGVPKVANDGPVGLARFTTLRSWLSQWSLKDTNAHGEKNAANITCPVMVINNTADLACTPSHAQRLYEAVAHDKKIYHDVKGADHYYIEKPELIGEAVEHCQNWLAKQG